MFVLINRHEHIIILEIKTLSCHSRCAHNTAAFWLRGRELHTVEGLFCFLGFRLDLCFEPLDFVFFKV